MASESAEYCGTKCYWDEWRAHVAAYLALRGAPDPIGAVLAEAFSSER